MKSLAALSLAFAFGASLLSSLAQADYVADGEYVCLNEKLEKILPISISTEGTTITIKDSNLGNQRQIHCDGREIGTEDRINYSDCGYQVMHESEIDRSHLLYETSLRTEIALIGTNSIQYSVVSVKRSIFSTKTDSLKYACMLQH